MSKKKHTQPTSSAPSSADSEQELINTLIKKRRLQQEALIKIMSSVEGEKERSQPKQVTPKNRRK